MNLRLRSLNIVLVIVTSILLSPNADAYVEIAEMDFDAEEICCFEIATSQEIVQPQIPVKWKLVINETVRFYEKILVTDCPLIRGNVHKIYCVFRE